MKLVILAGGSGTRLWPVSRKKTPKQVRPIIADRTMLVNTYERLRSRFRLSDIYIATNQHQLPLIRDQLPGFPLKNIIVEPEKRDTAAAIGLAATYLAKFNPQEIMININSDHFVKNEAEYTRILKIAEAVIKKKPKAGCLIGVNPTYPETGYGYIKMGEQAMEINKTKVFKIDRFEEKPDLNTAKQYLVQWEYLWNIGCFAWRIDTLLDQFRRFLPDTYRSLMDIKKIIGSEDEARLKERYFKKIKPISMDYGIIERVEELFVIPADFGWADVGNWCTVKDILSSNKRRSVIKGKIIHLDGSNNLVYNYSDKLVAMVGVRDLIYIETEDATLVCPKDRAQDVKAIVQELKKKNWEHYL